MIWGSRLTTEPDGKNVKDWVICSQEPYQIVLNYLWVKVQRLNDNGENKKNLFFLRYSLAPIKLNIPKGRVLSDEPTTKFCYCYNCGNRWRFC